MLWKVGSYPLALVPCLHHMSVLILSHNGSSKKDYKGELVWIGVSLQVLLSNKGFSRVNLSYRGYKAVVVVASAITLLVWTIS